MSTADEDLEKDLETMYGAECPECGKGVVMASGHHLYERGRADALADRELVQDAYYEHMRRLIEWDE